MFQSKQSLVKVEQLIVQHLYTAKSVTLQGIGTIHLNPAVHLPDETDKNTAIPENAFSFDYNLRAGEDPALIDFIVQQTRKIKPLASADLESYSILAKQFLNIGKPLTIEGIGTLMKNQAGVYEFTAGHFISPKVSEEIPKQLKEKEEMPVSFEHEATRKPGVNKNLLLFLFIILFAGLAGMGLYYFISKSKTQKTETVQEEQQQVPLPQDTIANKDTSHIANTDSNRNTTAQTPVVKDSNNFKIVLKEYPNEAAVNKAFAKLTSYGHKLVIIKVDSTKYQLAMPFTTALADTLRAKDSLKIFFGGKPYVITQ